MESDRERYPYSMVIRTRLSWIERNTNLESSEPIPKPLVR